MRMCRTVSNYANVQNGTAHGVYKAMKDGSEAMEVCSFTARERPMVEKVLRTTIVYSKVSGFGVAVENPCARGGPTPGSFYCVYAELVKELYFNLVCHCAWGVEWQKSTGIATSFAWNPVGKPGSGGKCVCSKAHKYMIHGPADRRPRVAGLAYHAAVCALPRGMLEEIYSAFVAREDAAISRWDSSSIVEKIQAVSMKIDERAQTGLVEAVECEVVISSAAPSAFTRLKPVNTTEPSRRTQVVQLRKKRMSMKCIELGLTADEIQEDTTTDTVRVLEEMARTDGGNPVDTDAETDHPL